ncbi:MAG: nicotinate-nucleotide adenylyltransferase [Planctomycetota bacterium]|nr:nicotinate-nucleotide adenylyltransferase [Planctomycetota bacterium]MCZ6815332.1 nicotinate-nucleotide adenylyltransferase [Planctomycetota bacterium]
MGERIGLYGGSFDPIHFGHLISARSVAEQLDFSRIILIPSARPPHKPTAAVIDARHRLEMARLAVAGDPLFEVSEVELHRAGPSYSIDTVDELGRQLGDQCDLFWIIGADSLPELATWHRIGELLDRIRIVTAARPGFVVPDVTSLEAKVGAPAVEKLISDRFRTPEIDISATGIRQRVRKGRSVRYLTPSPVAEYIAREGLYGKA